MCAVLLSRNTQSPAARIGRLSRPARRRAVAAGLFVILAAGSDCLARPPRARESRPAAGPLLPVRLAHPNGLAFDTAGNLLVSDIGTHRILRCAPSGALSSIAGTGEGGFSGDNGPAARARMFAPHDLVVASGGEILIADTYNHRIRRLDRQGRITSVVGDGRGAYRGDGGPALRASLNNPQGLALGPDGTFYIADTYNHVVRRVDPRGIITTFAGTEAGLAGDGGPALRARLSLPTAVAVAPDGMVYVSDSGNNRLRRITPAGTIETIVGSGPGSGTAGAGFAGDGEPAAKGKLFAAADVKVDARGNLFLSDTGNCRVRQIRNGILSTLAGSGSPGFSGDRGPAGQAALSPPQTLLLGSDGSVYFADRANHRVRRVDSSGRIETVCGRGAPSGILIPVGSERTNGGLR